jgi:hypothetical protein
MTIKLDTQQGLDILYVIAEKDKLIHQLEIENKRLRGLGQYDIKTIAKAIGYHFWEAKSDSEAISCGMSCAKDVVKELEG